MRRILFVLMLLMPGVLPAQYAYRIRPVPALPATCNPLNGEVVQLTAGAGVSPGIYSCTATNTWRPAGFMGNQMVWNQGTLTGSFPVINHTATWNNAAVTFTNIISNVTNTASNTASTLIDLQVGGASQFLVNRTGGVTATGSLTAGATAAIGMFGRSLMWSSVNGNINFTNNANNNFSGLTLGPEAVTHLRLSVSPAVGGQVQGLIIQKGDGTNAVFADLGAALNGSVIYCSNCTIASPCAGGGTGAIAKRLNGVWVCN